MFFFCSRFVVQGSHEFEWPIKRNKIILLHIVRASLLTVMFVCTHSGVWCVIQPGKSTSQNFPFWWAPSLDTWCSVSSLTGKILPFFCRKEKERKKRSFCRRQSSTCDVFVSVNSSSSWNLHSKVWPPPGADHIGAVHAGVRADCGLLCQRAHVQHPALLWGLLPGGDHPLAIRPQ